MIRNHAVAGQAERPAGFGAFLKQYREGRGLSQEVLAERAGLSADAIGALENGRRQAPYRETVAPLARALGLTAAERAALEASVDRRRAPPPPGPALPMPSPAAIPRHNLPSPATGLVGREPEVAHALALLQRPDGRLLTLTGPGGVGKTRLALRIATDVLDRAADFADGVWLVELAALADPALLPRAVAAALGLRESPGRSALAGLSTYLKDKQLLLVLDNCEHLIEACAALATALLRVCPRLRLLATSREGLAIGEETLYRVPSLAFPDPRQLPPIEELPGYAAVALLLERAQARGAAVWLSAHNAAAVAEVCARLDGIPLAIELAAARLSAMPVEQVAARLDDCFRLLTGGSRTAVPRQRTLRATMDWSYELLSRQEQAVLRRLAVFAGGWTLEAAEAICADAESDSAGTPLPRVRTTEADRDEATARVPPGAVLDALVGLVDKSLVLLDVSRFGDDVTPADEPRYRLLETMRQYAQEHLDAAGETVAVRDRHRGWCLALAEEGEVGIKGPAQVAWLHRLEMEHDNLRAALAWSVQGASLRPLEPQEQPYEVESEAGLRLAAALWWFWVEHGHLSEGLRWVDEALAAAGSAATVARARALIGRGYFTLVRHDRESNLRARALFQESLDLADVLGDRSVQARALFHLGLAAQFRSDVPEARRLFEEGLVLFREQQDGWFIARTLCRLGMCGPVFVDGKPDLERDVALFEGSLQAARGAGHPGTIAQALYNLGSVRLEQGDTSRAKSLIVEGLILARAVGDVRVVIEALDVSGLLETQLGDLERARAHFEESLRLGRVIGNPGFQGAALLHLGILAVVSDDVADAATAATSSLSMSRVRLPDVDRYKTAGNMLVLACVAQRVGQPMRAVRLFGAFAALTAPIGQAINAGPADTLFGRLQLVADAA